MLSWGQNVYLETLPLNNCENFPRERCSFLRHDLPLFEVNSDSKFIGKYCGEIGLSLLTDQVQETPLRAEKEGSWRSKRESLTCVREPRHKRWDKIKWDFKSIDVQWRHVANLTRTEPTVKAPGCLLRKRRVSSQSDSRWHALDSSAS